MSPVWHWLGYPRSPCAPDWFQEHRPCPYGTVIQLPKAGFTWPSHPSASDGLAVAFCTEPFLIGCILLCLILRTRGLRELAGLVFLAEDSLVHEILKVVLGPNMRPQGSCLITCGNPSGHCMTAYGVAAILICEEFRCHSYCLRRVASISLVCILLLPMPWARQHLHDHSCLQTFTGSLCGFFNGLLFELFLFWFMTKYGSAIVRRTCFRDNYCLPIAATLDSAALTLAETGLPPPASLQGTVVQECDAQNLATIDGGS